MYVKSIVLDGFKSYGQRTEINGFDRQFNAITGLNGSGKSNILDAICFLLGVQNLTQVRAQLLQDLVYRQGQAGINKASVTMVFDNSDKARSPVAYEKYDEIIITRTVFIGNKNKYLINGVNATNNDVKNLFLSVQLNVNNPHFLVMQGKIAKVICMKPMEILSLIEEASGTRMFETKKQNAEKTLKKKDFKLASIDEIINEDIGPKLAKLKEERGQYLEYKKVERELEHLQKVYIAWKFLSSKENSQKAGEQAEALIEKIKEKRLAIKSSEGEAQSIMSQVEALQQEKDAESGGKLSALQKGLLEKEKALARHALNQKQNVESISDEKKKIEQLEKSVKDDENFLKQKSGSMSKIDGVFQNLASEIEKDKADLEKAQKKFQAVSSGLVEDESGAEGTLQDKLMASERIKAETQTEIEQCKRQKTHCESDLTKKSAEMQKTAKDFQKDNQMMENLELEVKNLKAQVDGLNFDEERVSALQQEERQLRAETRDLRYTRDTFESRDGRLTFRYTDPERNFNRKSVHGLVCKLIEVSDPQFAAAVEKTAGGSLFNVVVDTDVTSKKLLSNGKLERRTTIIPLNKISGRRINAGIVQTAEKIAGRNNVWPAISLIQYSDALQPAMEYIFGSTFVCRDLATAKKVCYHPKIKTRCVTLDGDTCDPSGTLSGGAPQETQPILLKLLEIKSVLRELDAKDMRITDIERELRGLVSQQDRYVTLKQRQDLQEHELNLVKQRLQQTTHYQYQEEVNALKEQIAQFSKRQEECQEIIAKETQNIKEIQDRVKNAKANRAKEVKAAEDEVKRLKKKAEESRKEREKRSEEHDSLKLELEDLKKSIETNYEQIEKHKASVIQLEEKNVEFDDEVQKGKEAVNEMQAEVKALKEQINKKNKEITQALQRKEKLAKEAMNFELEIKQYQQDHDKLRQESRDAKQRVSTLLKQHDWIAQEEQYFGKPNGVYDFKETDPHDAGKRVVELQEVKDKLGRNINAKAMNLLAQTEEQYNDLMKKRKQVQEDKEMILQVIEELAEKKKQVLKDACSQVNRDFESIFKTLLPGAHANLVPVNPRSVLDGLEFRVGFGGKFKESLGELSGGQKSLVALSLILAMLLFKPAPIYILDEVDAALDLSHTQNIGKMLKTHFKTSQFIIVSLKDGMFNNANVLFRTQFVDSVSTVTRTVQSSR